MDRSIYHLSSLAVLAAIHDVTKDIPPFVMMIVGEFAALSQMIETESRVALSIPSARIRAESIIRLLKDTFFASMK